MIVSRHTKTLQVISTGLLMTVLAAGLQAESDPQGLYSARALLDAEVHFAAAPDSQPSRVADLLLGDDQRVHAIVVHSDSNVGQGGDALVVANTHYRLVNHGGNRHDIIVDADPATLESLPRYDQAWWDSARQRTREAWQRAGEGAESAWQRTQRGLDQVGESAESAWERTQQGAERAGRRISETLEDWRNDD